MEKLNLASFARILVALVSSLSLCTASQSFRALSTIDPAQNPPSGGCGDSWAPVMSPDGRYVLFASTANNLLHNSNNAAMPTGIPPALNVFLRDRTNSSTTLVSVNLAGTAGGNGNSFPMELSTNAQYVLFESSANDLVIGDTNLATDIFVRDLINRTTILVSVDTNGLAANGGSRSATMTPDGRYVAFVSAANNLVAGDTNRIDDVFVRDLQSPTTRLVSVGGVRRDTFSSYSPEAPDITADGRYISFYSTATNVVQGVPRGGDVYVRDLLAGATIWVSSYARTALSTNAVACFNHAFTQDGKFVVYEGTRTSSSSHSYFGSIFLYDISSGTTTIVDTNAAVTSYFLQDIHDLDMSPDGRFIAFVSNTNGTNGATTCIRLWDAAVGASILISGDANDQVPDNSTCDWPTLDPNGRFVAFLSGPSNLTSNPLIGDYHLYLRDTQTATTSILNADTNGVSVSVTAATIPRISTDGRFVAFECADSELVADDRNRDPDVFVRDLTTGASELISVRDGAFASRSPNGPALLSGASVSADGRYLVFVSDADNLVPNDTNGVRDVFVRDLASNTTMLVSAATNGSVGDGPSAEPVITPDGHYVAFASLADNLVVGDTNRVQDVFARDLRSGTTTRASVNSVTSLAPEGDSYSPSISDDGRFVPFLSKSTKLATGSFTPVQNAFIRDLNVGTNYVLTRSGGSIQSMTPDGKLVVFIGNLLFGGSSNLYVWNTALAARSYTNSNSAIAPAAINAAGTAVVFWAGRGTTSLYTADLVSDTTRAIAPGLARGSKPALRFSADGLGLVYVASLNSTNQLYLYDYQAGATILISHGYNSPASANGDSDSPTISADGRFVAYRSAAVDLVTGITNGLPQIFLYDRQTDSNTLLSSTLLGNPVPNNRSLMPFFGQDDGIVFFESWASDLVPDDFNHSADLFSFALLTARILPALTAGEGHWLSWPWESNKNYGVQYKQNLNDPGWHEAGGTITNNGLRVFFHDQNPGASQRFYRVVAF